MSFFSDPYFPNSLYDPFFKTSETDWKYNCIAHAYGNDTNWFWPISNNYPSWFWPPHIPKALHIDSFIKLFEDIGYERCIDGSLEIGFQKVAIFEKDNIPTHAAKQLLGGLWSSKLGQNKDAAHTIKCIEGSDYGYVSVYMKRAIYKDLPVIKVV